MLYGKNEEGQYKCVSMSMSDDGFGKIKQSDRWSTLDASDFDFEPLWMDDNMERAPEVFSQAVENANYPQDSAFAERYGTELSLDTSIKNLSGIEGMSASTYNNENGEPTNVIRTLTQRLF